VCPDSRVGQAVGLEVVFSPHVRDGELKRAGQLAADPMQRIETRAAADVFPVHLPHHYFGIGVDVKLPGFEGQSTLQGFQQSNIFGYVIILASNPLRDSDCRALSSVDHDSNSGRPRISQRSAVYVGHHIRHAAVSPRTNMRYSPPGRQELCWFEPLILFCFLRSHAGSAPLCIMLWKNREYYFLNL